MFVNQQPPTKKEGFTLDSSGNVLKIHRLYPAAQWFIKKFTENNEGSETLRHIEIVDSIKGEFFMNYSKDAESRIEERRKDITYFNICLVVKVEYLSVFNTPGYHYYYVIYRNKWFNKWANIYYERLKRYFNQDGITVKIDILNHPYKSPLTNENIIDISTLVVVEESTDIYYLPMKEVKKWAEKVGIFTDKYNQTCCGFPKEMFSLNKDLNEYT